MRAAAVVAVIILLGVWLMGVVLSDPGSPCDRHPEGFECPEWVEDWWAGDRS